MMKINPIIEFYKPMKENELKKKIQKFSKFSKNLLKMKKTTTFPFIIINIH